MRLEEISEMAEIDLKIDKTNLAESSVHTPMLVHKYYMILIEEGRILKALDMKLMELYKERYDFYLHLAPPEAYIEEPFNRKVLKSEVDTYIYADKKYTTQINKIETQKYKVKFLEEIIKQFNNRNFIIKAILEDQRFKNGGF